MEGKLNFLFAILAVILIASVALLTYSCSTPAMPSYFNRKLSFEDALSSADQNGKVVFALFTAEGSEPCAAFKKGALRDQRVVDWMAASAQAAYVDMTRAEAGGGDAAALAARHSIEDLPTVLLLRKGREIARLTGQVSARDSLQWLEESTRAAPTPGG